jgi:hypothetical protein
VKLFDRTIVLFLGICAAIIFLQRLHTFDEPLECDTALFSVLAHEWRLGRPLYSDLWDNKPPGIILTYAIAQAVAGSGPRSILLLGTLASILTLVGVYFAAFWMTGNCRAGLWAAAFWTLVNAAPYLEANQPVAEVFVNACWTWGAAFLFRFWREEAGPWDLWIAGSCLAAAGFYKHHIAFVNGIIIFGFFGAWINEMTRQRRSVIQILLPSLAPIAILWIAVFGYFALTHRAAILWDTLVTYSRFYARLSSSGGTGIRLEILYAIAPLALAALIGLPHAFKTKDRRWIFALSYVTAAWAGIALPGRYYAHYFQLLLAPAGDHRRRRCK